MSTVLLASRRVLLPGGIGPATVRVVAGRISAIEAGPAAPRALDLGADLLMPGVIDASVHLGEPGSHPVEGFASGTLAAAAGGTTTLADAPWPNTPPTTSVDALALKLTACGRQLFVDLAFWGGVAGDTPHALAALLRSGVRGLRVRLDASDDPERPSSSLPQVRAALPLLAEAGLPLVVDGAPGPDTFRELVASAAEAGAALAVLDLQDAALLPLLRSAKAAGQRVTAGTTPQALTFSADREPLWGALTDGTLDLVASGHDPRPGGVAALQLLLRATWTEAAARRVPLADTMRWLTAAPAAFLGLGDRGRLRLGARADLVRWRPEDRRVVQPDELHQRGDIGPFRGHRLDGVVRDVWVAGERVVENGAPLGTPTGRAVLTGAPAGG